METSVTALFASEKLDLIIVATKDMNITLLKFSKKEHLNLSRIHTFEVQLNES